MSFVRHHRRTPALAVLVAVLGVGWSVLLWDAARGGVSDTGSAAHTESGADRRLAALEIAIASEQATAADWYAYAESLWARRQYADTALACQEVLEREPYHREAQFRRGLALAAAGRAEEFYGYMRELSWSEPKLAVDLFARAEARPYLGDERLRSLRREALNQAMD